MCVQATPTSSGVRKPFGGYHIQPGALGLPSDTSGAGGKVAVVAEQTGTHLGEAEEAFLVLDRMLCDTTASFVSRSRGHQQSDDGSDQSAHQGYSYVRARSSPAHDRFHLSRSF